MPYRYAYYNITVLWPESTLTDHKDIVQNDLEI